VSLDGKFVRIWPRSRPVLQEMRALSHLSNTTPAADTPVSWSRRTTATYLFCTARLVEVSLQRTLRDQNPVYYKTKHEKKSATSSIIILITPGQVNSVLKRVHVSLHIEPSCHAFRNFCRLGRGKQSRVQRRPHQRPRHGLHVCGHRGRFGLVVVRVPFTQLGGSTSGQAVRPEPGPHDMSGERSVDQRGECTR